MGVMRTRIYAKLCIISEAKIVIMTKVIKYIQLFDPESLLLKMNPSTLTVCLDYIWEVCP